MATQQPYQQIDLSGGVQSATSRFLRKKNELASSRNADYRRKIGSAARRDGYEQVGRTIEHGNDGLGAHVYRYGANNKILIGINDAADAFTTVRYLDSDNYWTNLITDIAPNTRLQMHDFLNECYIFGASDTNTYMAPRNLNSGLNVSTTRNLYGAPRAKFVTDFQNGLVALNCEVNGVKYPDRFYLSSPALGFITRVQNDQVGSKLQLVVDSVRYLKAGMVIDIYGQGTNAKKVDSLTIISVNKAENIITFAQTAINVKDNDEIWLEDRKGQLSLLWNTDYPTPEDNTDWRSIPPGVDASSDITAHGKNNNRLLIFTENSTWKFDGNNLVNVSETVGCVAPETVKNVGDWTLWLHTTGVWGYNDSVGRPKLLSRGIDNYIKAINLATIERASAVVAGRVYKLAVGEIAELEASTTSTSTSSTSTSSTSSSTSSTSTSSTSTSSTSTSTTNTTTSTSSTSSSTSSTSTSSTSRSTSTSSTSSSTSTSSTTTTTVASTKDVLRLVYDFDGNTWTPEYHKREFRYQFTHQMNGYIKPYFLDETGRLFRDETANLDHFDTIPFEVITGRSNQGTGQKKAYVGCVVYSERARGAQVFISVDNQQFHPIGQITEDVQELIFPSQPQIRLEGRDINYKVSHNDDGDAPIIDGFTTFFSLVQTRLG